MDFDLTRVPFSRYGSYLAFSVLPALPTRPQGLYLRTVHGGAAVREIARVEVIRNGRRVPYAIRASPACLRLEAESGLVEICIPQADQVRLRTRGVGLRLVFSPESYDCAFPAYQDAWQVISWTCSINLALESIKGGWQVDAPFPTVKAESMTADLLPTAGEEGCEGAIIEFGSAWSPQPNSSDFDECIRSVDKDFQGWLERTPALPPEYNEARQLAAYVNWSGVVSPSGHLKRPSMFMSKNWMTNVWSWDHCFNALSLVYHAPEQAWDQLMVMFDCQDQQGALPDSANDACLVWSFCKPPVHGWTLLRMLERTDWITPAHLDQLYGPLQRWTNWWLRTRDYDGDGIPQYHHGNDSGWDNCTAFEAGLPLESPDLSAFLVIQMDALAEVASRLHIENEAQGWKHKSQELLHKMLVHFWRGDHFIVTQSGLHKDYWSDSLFYYLPILLGKRLPVEIQRSLVAGLKNSGLITKYGLATENPSSPRYEADGYWRGPIWAPSSMLIVEGLAAMGEVELASKISRKFCDMAARSGMAENFDALTGQGLRDLAYTWTSSVFLLLGNERLSTGAPEN